MEVRSIWHDYLRTTEFLDATIENLKGRRDVRPAPRRHGKLAARFQDTSDLVEGARLIGNMQHAKIADDRIKFCICKVKVLRICLDEGSGGDASAGMFQHHSGKIGANNVDAPIQQCF